MNSKVSLCCFLITNYSSEMSVDEIQIERCDFDDVFYDTEDDTDRFESSLPPKNFEHLIRRVTAEFGNELNLSTPLYSETVEWDWWESSYYYSGKPDQHDYLLAAWTSKPIPNSSVVHYPDWRSSAAILKDADGKTVYLDKNDFEGTSLCLSLDDQRMVLTREHVEFLIPYFQYFLKNGWNWQEAAEEDE